jgi:hypothetical protein
MQQGAEIQYHFEFKCSKIMSLIENIFRNIIAQQGGPPVPKHCEIMKDNSGFRDKRENCLCD